MLGVLKLFDAYTIRARIIPSLLGGLPAFALILAAVPWDHLGLPNVIVTIASFVLLYALGDFARRRGHKVERRLGTRSTLFLWHRSNKYLPDTSKDIYRSYIAEKLGKAAPSAEDEVNNPAQADDFYAGAGNWLREETRDTKRFNILFDDLIAYGFRRNLLGLKYVAIGMNVIVASAVGLILYWMPQYFASISHINEKLYVVLLTAVLHTLCMIFWVNEGSVKDASLTYGKQLILSCGTLMKATSARSRTTKTKKPN